MGIINPPPQNPPPASKPPAAKPSSMSPTQWAQLVAKDLNLGNNPNAVTDILSWMKNEEPTSTWWGGFGSAAAPTRLNPLNAGDIGHFGYGADPVTKNVLAGGLGTYPTLTDAASASAQMIEQANMAPILQALQQGVDPAAFQAAAASSPWAGGHYAGDAFSVQEAQAEAAGKTVTGNAVGAGGVTPGAAQQSAAATAANAIASQFGPALASSKSLSDAMLAQMQLQQQDYAQQLASLKANYGFTQQLEGVQQGEQTLQVHETEQQYNENYALRQYQLQQDTLSGQNLQNQFQQILLGQKQGEQGLAAGGVYNTGAHGQFEQGVALQKAANQIQQQQLGVTEAQQASQYGYTQQQVRNGLSQLALQQQKLGISDAQAATQFEEAKQQLGLGNIMSTEEMMQQIGATISGAWSPISGTISQFADMFPGVAGLIGGGAAGLAAATSTPGVGG